MAAASDKSPWPAWARHSLSGAIGAGAVIVGVTIAFGDARRDASDAKRDLCALEPRVTAVENRVTMIDARGSARYESLLQQISALQRGIDEGRGDLKEILKRLPK